MITGEQLLEVFATYNPQIWPMQIVAYVLGFAAVFLAVRKTALSGRIVAAILAFFWLWVALMFWLPSVLQGFMPGILFVLVFLIQGGLWVWQAVKPRLIFGFSRDICSWAGILFILYALVGYPLVGGLLGHTYPRMSPFGLTPCPVVTFTFGLLLLAKPKIPRTLLILPLFYAFSGFVWISIGMWEDIGMILSGILGAGLTWWRETRKIAATYDKSSPVPARGGWSLDLPDNESTN